MGNAFVNYYIIQIVDDSGNVRLTGKYSLLIPLELLESRRCIFP